MLLLAPPDGLAQDWLPAWRGPHTLVLVILVLFCLALKAQEPTNITYRAPVSGLEGEASRFSETHLYINVVIENQETSLSLSCL